MQSRIALFAAVVLAGGLIFFITSRGRFSWQSLRTGGAVDLATLGTQTGGLPESASSSAPAHRFSHRAPDVSFELPAGFTAGSFKDPNGETILVHGPQGAEFQIYITPQDEDFAVTKERIDHDVPGTAIRDPKNIRLDGAPGLLFASEDASLGATRELWFEYRGFLYQATSRDAFGNGMITIMGTWKFE